MQQIIGQGLCCDDELDQLTIDKGSDRWAAFIMQLIKPAEVHEIHFMAASNQAEIYVLVNDIARDWTDIHPYTKASAQACAE